MQPISDYHIHTKLCGHASGEPSAYAEHACSVGLTEIGFSDHAPLVAYQDPEITMELSQLPIYHKIVEDVRREFVGRLSVKIGVEADYLPGYEADTKAILDNYPYDYVLGSVHFIDGWGFDNPRYRDRWEQVDVDEVYVQYHECLRAAAKSGMFDIMAHVDLVKKFVYRPTKELSAEVVKTAHVFKETGMVIEINTSGLRKPVKEIYPSLADLKIYCAAGVPITFGSDAHSPKEVGKDFDRGVELARQAGYKEYVLFKRRRIDQIIKF